MPRWVKVAGIITLVVVALVIILLLFGGEHGPSRHGGPGGPGGHTPPAAVSEAGHVPPGGHR